MTYFLQKPNIFSQLERHQYATREVMESRRNGKYISTSTKYALMNLWNILVRYANTNNEMLSPSISQELRT